MEISYYWLAEYYSGELKPLTEAQRANLARYEQRRKESAARQEQVLRVVRPLWPEMQAAGAFDYGYSMRYGYPAAYVEVNPNKTPFEEFRARFQPRLGDIPLIVRPPMDGLEFE